MYTVKFVQNVKQKIIGTKKYFIYKIILRQSVMEHQLIHGLFYWFTASGCCVDVLATCSWVEETVLVFALVFLLPSSQALNVNL